MGDPGVASLNLTLHSRRLHGICASARRQPRFVSRSPSRTTPPARLTRYLLQDALGRLEQSVEGVCLSHLADAISHVPPVEISPGNRVHNQLVLRVEGGRDRRAEMDM